jgi:hypothetical protein
MAKQPSKRKPSASKKGGMPAVNTKGQPPWKSVSMYNGPSPSSRIFNYSKGDSTMTIQTKDGKIISKTKGKKK